MSQLDLFINSVLLGGSRDLWGPLPASYRLSGLLDRLPTTTCCAQVTISLSRKNARAAPVQCGQSGRLTFGDARAVLTAQANESRLTRNSHDRFFAAMLTAG